MTTDACCSIVTSKAIWLVADVWVRAVAVSGHWCEHAPFANLAVSANVIGQNVVHD